MKRKITLTAFILFVVLAGKAQNFTALNYFNNGTPTHGVKIKTNLPFLPANQMPTVIIEGYNFGTHESIGLIISYYTYYGVPNDNSNPDNCIFWNHSVSSFGSYTPDIYLASENGKVIIYLDGREYHQRFTVRCFAQGMLEQPGWFQGWSAVDEPNTGIKTVLVPYKNRFKGNVVLPGNSVWKSDGFVGIGTNSPDAKLSVKGNIRAQEIKVETSNWPDYVFSKEYQLPSLAETEKHIKTKGHLPGIPSAREAEANGVDLGEMNKKLLEKIEELTLHLIRQETELKRYQKNASDHQREIDKLNQAIKGIQSN